MELHPLVGDLLKGRGLAGAELDAYLRPDYDQHLHDPFLLTDMKPAVERVLAAITAKQKIIIYGDYDIDGLTASAVMLDALGQLGGQAEAYIPDRFEEGYGLNLEALKKLQTGGADLIISVDCGVTAVVEAEWARANDLDLIITDHHAVPAQIPAALAVINPKRPDDPYPFKELAGVGVAFKLVQALQAKAGKPAAGQEKWLLDLVALGTVCDVVPLVGENRVLAKYGLQVLTKTRRPGLVALAEVAGVDLAEIKSYNLGFMLGPRLNAAGRLEHAAKALELLTTTEPARAREIADELNQLNRQRQTDQAAILASAITQAGTYPGDDVLVLADTNWSHGIVGIVASKLVERYRRPVLVAQILGATTKGSARSTGNFNMVEALTAAKAHLIKYGGHRYAAGYTLKTAKLAALRRALNQHYRQVTGGIEPSALTTAELEVTGFDQLDWDLQAGLNQLEPFGHGNPQPIFGLTGTKVVSVSRVGADAKHLRLTFTDHAGQIFPAIAFNLAEQHPNLTAGQTVDISFQLARNDFNGQSSLQLVVAEIK